MAVPLQWDGVLSPHHIAVMETAHRRFDFLAQAVQRIYAVVGEGIQAIRFAPLATGGAMAVYTATVASRQGNTWHLICKIPHARRLVYQREASQQQDETATLHLLERLTVLAQRLAQRAPGLFPRSGGLWHWREGNGTFQCVLVEEFIPGTSVERLKFQYEEALVAGHLSPEAYRRRRTALERLAVATFTRLWDCLDRRLFTADPSPWNVLVRRPNSVSAPPQATIIDLHSLEEPVAFDYVLQRLAAVYGMRQATVEEVLIPGILEALGVAEGRSLLYAILPSLEVQAAQSRRQLGVDLQRPLISAIRALG